MRPSGSGNSSGQWSIGSIKEAAAAIVSGRNLEVLCRSTDLLGALVVCKEEGFIPTDRTTNCAAEDVLDKDAALSRCVIVAGIESSVSQEVEDIAVDLVGAALRYDG